METQVQLGMRPQFHPYLFIIFFATIFEYNMHRLVTILTEKEALEDEKHNWVSRNRTLFYLLVAVSVIGFLISVALAKRVVLITLAPIALVTIFYSLPVFKNATNIFRLREIPALKIFLIAFVWSAATILLPIIQSGVIYNEWHVLLMFIERFLFVFAITIPFDIRDMRADARSGLKTIPLLIGKTRAIMVANGSLILFLILSILHYADMNLIFIIVAMIISGFTTFIFINAKRLNKFVYYYYLVLDGTMLLQGLLVLICYYAYLFIF
jgi:4-hydroxybenzoate polyprenyltransferase